MGEIKVDFRRTWYCIPGMSEGKFSFNEKMDTTLNDIEQHLPVLHNLGTDDTDALQAAAEALRSANTGVLPETYRLSGNLIRTIPTVLGNMPPDIFIMMHFLRLKSYNEALYYINQFIKDPDPRFQQPEVIHLAMRDYLKMMTDEKPAGEIEETLKLIYGNDTGAAVINNFSQEDTIFSRLPLNTCFSCETCPGSHHCNHFEVLRIIRSVQGVQRKNPIDQAQVKSIFSD